MFNKPNQITRTDAVTRKDIRPIIGSISSSGTPEAASVTEAPTSTPATKSSEMNTPDTGTGARLIVGPEVKLKGAEILDCDTLVVEGRVEATMDSRFIRITEKGSFSGKVSIDIAEIHGNFEGELTARSQLIIHATGKVSGKIRYGKLVIDEGGELCGDINAISAENRNSTRSANEHVPTLNAVAG